MSTKCRHVFIAAIIMASACLTAGSAFADAPQFFNAGMSMTSYQLNRLAGDASGKPSTLGTTFYHLYLQGNLTLGTPMLMFSPNLRYMPTAILANETPDGGATIAITTLGLPVLVRATDMLYAGGGPLILRQDINGKGGTKELDNGNGKSTFALPGRKVSTTTVALDLVAQLHWQQIMASFDLIVQGPASKEKRSLSLSLSFAYAFGGRR